MRYSVQIRAARALLGMKQEELAKASKTGLATIQRIEQGEGLIQANYSTVLKIQSALEKAGVTFIDANGEIGAQVDEKRLTK